MTVDVKEFLLSTKWEINQEVDLTGWLVDKSGGLCLLADHSPLNYYHEQEVRVVNSNIIYAILKFIPSLAGGLSLLFYKAKILGRIEKIGLIKVEEIFIQSDRSQENLSKIDISDEVIFPMIKLHGDYKFIRPLNPSGDWMDSVG